MKNCTNGFKVSKKFQTLKLSTYWFSLSTIESFTVSIHRKIENTIYLLIGYCGEGATKNLETLKLWLN